MPTPRATEQEIGIVNLYLTGACEPRHRWALPLVSTKIDWHYESFLQWAAKYGYPTMSKVALRHGLKKAYPLHVKGAWTINVCRLEPRCWTDGKTQAVWDGVL